MKSLSNLSGETRILLALSVGGPLGGILGCMLTMWIRRVSVPEYETGMDYAGAAFALGAMVVGGLGGFCFCLMLHRIPAVTRNGILLSLVLVCSVCYGRNYLRQQYIDRRLFAAVKSGNLDQASWWLNHMPNLTATNENGETPIELALKKGDCKMVACLLNADFAPSTRSGLQKKKIEAVCGTDPDVSLALERE